jgi:acyl-coenzyme A thioesterase PaaI-like protein
LSVAIQDQLGIPNHCYGCGRDNPAGLQLKSFWEDERAVASVRLPPHFSAGTTDAVNGGVLATLVDCHSMAAGIAAAYAAERRAIGSAPQIWCVTGAMEITYLRPTPLAEELTLDARVEADDGRRLTVACTLSAAGKERVRARVVAVRVAPR